MAQRAVIVMMMRMSVGVSMRMVVTMAVMVIRGIGQLALHEDIDLRRMNPAAVNFLNFQRSAKRKRRQRFAQQIDRDAGLHKRSEQHIAADTGEHIEVSNAHNETYAQMGGTEII